MQAELNLWPADQMWSVNALASRTVNDNTPPPTDRPTDRLDTRVFQVSSLGHARTLGATRHDDRLPLDNRSVSVLLLRFPSFYYFRFFSFLITEHFTVAFSPSLHNQIRKFVDETVLFYRRFSSSADFGPSRTTKLEELRVHVERTPPHLRAVTRDRRGARVTICRRDYTSRCSDRRNRVFLSTYCARERHKGLRSNRKVVLTKRGCDTRTELGQLSTQQ